MHRPGEDKGYANPILPFVVAIIMWMWAGVIYLSGDREISFPASALTDTLKWAFGYMVAAIFFVILGGLFLWFGVWRLKNKEKFEKEKDPDIGE
jgi:hypothetical protein